ncbi:MAG: hypothetical protein ACD_65C00376G0016 [uncultured bacterium]|nr:MAG: hypothetical protein ACD_65C00376G0016 [uncultured bacterium]
MWTNNKLQAILNDLNKVDWSFEASSSNGDLTSLHPYPARFIPAIPKTIIEMVQKYNKHKKLRILDPFAGCGTVLTEGLKHNCDVVGIDINGLAHLLEEVYTTSVSKLDVHKLTLLKMNVMRVLRSNKHVVPTPDIPHLDHWFDLNSITLISNTLFVINKEKVKKVRQLGLLSLSRILVQLSRQKSETQYVAVQKFLTNEQKINLLSDSFDIVIDFYSKQKKFKNKSSCILGDSRQSDTYLNVSNINLVITSPPYPNAYEYWLYHKYRMYWMGMDPIWSRTNEIGTRPHYSGSGKKNEWDFYRDIKKILFQIDKVSSKDALQFWVVGDSIIKGKKINNSKIVIDAALEIGWENVATCRRKINRKRSSFQGIGNKEFENLLIFAK